VQGFHYSGALAADQCLAWIVEFNATAMAAAGDNTVTTALRPRKLGAAFFVDATPRTKSAVRK
jgi:hypothetical protein